MHDLGGSRRLPFVSEDDQRIRTLLSLALIAVECENSLWIANQMPQYGKPLTPQRRLDGRLGLGAKAVLPTVIIKEEDRAPLRSWQEARSIPIHMWHAFFDEAYSISLTRANELVDDGLIGPTKQTFQAPGGATSTKVIFKIYRHYAYLVARSTEEPQLEADRIIDKNGHILPYVRFVGGKLGLTKEALRVLGEQESNG